jgi:hypothetical protein
MAFTSHGLASLAHTARTFEVSVHLILNAERTVH